LEKESDEFLIAFSTREQKKTTFNRNRIIN